MGEMEPGKKCCPVCTLYLREGITLKSHLDTHPKDKVIEALLKVTNDGPPSEQRTSSETATESTSSEVFPSQQPYVAPAGTAYMSQTQNYVNPQTQVTAAVTYQQFVTNNGSVVMPQYIQVPTIVSPNSNVPVIPNQTLNYVPNQPNAYAHTMYNPLYNPYIPQPYPFQPFYTSMPVTSESNNTQCSASQVTSTAASTAATNTTQDVSKSIARDTLTTATNTASERVLVEKYKAKKLPIKSTTQTKFKIIKQLGSRLKTTTSTLATVATKSFRITSINSKTNSTAKTSAVTKAKSVKTKQRPILPKPSPSSTSPSSSSTAMASPPPLTPMTRSRSSSISCSETFPPPPLSKAPYLTSSLQDSTQFDLSSVVKTEALPSSESHLKNNLQLNILDPKDERNDADYTSDNDERPSVNSVIVESNSAIQITSNLVIGSPIPCESDGAANNSFSDETASPQKTAIDGRTEEIEELEEGNDEEDKRDESNIRPLEVERCQLQDERDEGSDYEEELSEKVFHSFEFEAERKVAINFGIGNQDGSNEVNGEPEVFIREESIPFVEEDVRVKAGPPDVQIGRYLSTGNNYPRKGPAITPQTNDAVYTLKVPLERSTTTEGESPNLSDPKALTYTDLQPATNSKVLHDLGIATSLNLNNCMEVDGIKIYFNNANVQNVPLEPIIKFTSSLKGDMTKVQSLRKTDYEPREKDTTIVESVIHLVSTSPQRNEIQVEPFANSNSHPGEPHAELRDLSPLTLNIRADESMPARGELSEQESLGAENSTWGLFHSESTTLKISDGLKTETREAPATVQRETVKTFKCRHCPETFTSLKDRREHRIASHEKTRGTQNPKTFVCVHCKEKFTSLQERRRHVVQNHLFDPKKVKKIKQEGGESREESGTAVDVVPIKLESSETAIKSETSGETNALSVTEVMKMCPGCDLKFAGTKKLKEHLREVHGVSRYKCGTCSEMFDTEREYNTHLRIHPLGCNQCGKMFHRKPNLQLHLRRHLIVKPYECTQCPKSFITRQKLDEHLNSHSGNKPLKCSLCDRTFSRYSNLIQHKNIHHLYGKKKVKDFVCRCGEVFHSLRKLEWHKEVHDTKPKTCPFCSQKFIHSNSVTRHIRRSHMPNYLPSDKSDNENVQCPVCGKIYLKSSLAVHMRVHNGEKPFVCKICNKRFTTKWNLELHNWTHQSRNNMPFKCTICKSAFFREVDYTAHLNSHRNYRPFTCNICGQKFIRKYNCLRHQEEHKKEKKFVCTVSGCQKSFHRSYYLRDHMRVHTGVRPHTCHICGKASSTKSNHNKHVRIHDTREPMNTEN